MKCDYKIGTSRPCDFGLRWRPRSAIAAAEPAIAALQNIAAIARVAMRVVCDAPAGRAQARAHPLGDEARGRDQAHYCAAAVAFGLALSGRRAAAVGSWAGRYFARTDRSS